MYNLEVVTTGDGAEHYEYPSWEALIESVNGLQAVFEAGIVSDISIWTELD